MEINIGKYKINLSQPKYKYPLYAYAFFFVVGCFILHGMNNTAVPQKQRQGIDTNVPDADVDSILSGKGLGSDYGEADGTLQGINDSTQQEGSLDDSFEKGGLKESPGSQDGITDNSTADQREALARAEAERAQANNLRQMQDRVRSNRGSSSYNDDYVAPLSDNEIAQAQQRRRRRIMQSLDDDLYGSRERQIANSGGDDGNNNRRGVYNPVTGQMDYPPSSAYDGYGGGGDTSDGAPGEQGGNRGGSTPAATQPKTAPVELARKVKTGSDYFNTLSSNKKESGLITAIIDENIKAVEGSRVRLKLLDDIQIGDHLVKKGTRLYVTMSGFGSQRVKGSIQSILIDDKIVHVNLDIYDMDGLEGLYVPESSFREFRRDVAEGITDGSSTITSGYDVGNTNSVLKNWGSNAVQNSSNRAMNAIRRAIQKNAVKLKFGTRVYLINDSDIEEADRR